MRVTAVSAHMTRRVAIVLLPLTAGVIVILITVLLGAGDVLSSVNLSSNSATATYCRRDSDIDYRAPGSWGCTVQCKSELFLLGK